MLVSSCSVHAVLGVIKMSYVVVLVLLVDWESHVCVVICSQMCLLCGPQVKSCQH